MQRAGCDGDENLPISSRSPEAIRIIDLQSHLLARARPLADSNAPPTAVSADELEPENQSRSRSRSHPVHGTGYASLFLIPVPQFTLS